MAEFDARIAVLIAGRLERIVTVLMVAVTPPESAAVEQLAEC